MVQELLALAGPLMRRWLLRVVLLAILAAIAIWAIRKWDFSRHHESTDDAQVSGHLLPVLTRVAGYVAVVHVRDNDPVTEGALLVQLEDVEPRPDLAFATITAPVTGLVAKRSVDPGQYVLPGQPLMVVVADTGAYLTANFKETQIDRLRPGQPVAFRVAAYKGCQGEGVLESLSGATGAEFALLPPDNTTGNFVKVVQRIPVRVQITRGCGPGRRLRPGMSVTVHVRTR